MKILKVAAVVFALSFVWCGAGYAMSADDFLPPAQAADVSQKEALLEVKDEASVKTEVDPVLKTEVTTASALQDAINAKIKRPKQGCELIVQQDGGIVFVATGLGTYNPGYANPVASRIEQRGAYLEAIMNAKAEMARTAAGLTSRGADTFNKNTDTLDTGEGEGLANIDKNLSETQQQTARKVLKGYVTYAVQDSRKNGQGMVYVTLVSSPKTRGNYTRNGTEGISAASLRDGLNSVIAEIKSGLVPPVGGRVIDVPATGEVAFVGFGSHVVRKNSDASVQAELDLQAEQIAGLRSTDALVGIILGDDTLWAAHVDEDSRKQVNQFKAGEASDPSAQSSEAENKDYDDRMQGFRNTVTSSLNIQNLRNGALPPGVMRETSLDDDEYFAYGIAVYVPSLTEAARKGAKEMDEAQIVQPPSKSSGGTAVKPVPKKEQNLEMKQGPSGVIKQDL
ncbi:hypothetical protein FACS1894204_12910 [Synergistales bacterium]|nr:hypothetical protein FACS1894204_12910 [Synergistales bacterium]